MTKIKSKVLTLSFPLLLGGLSFPMASYAGVSALQVAQQNATCKGVIVDVNNQPVVGATVVVKGTKKNTLTGADGKFSLSNVKPGSVILISCFGYVKQEIKWTGKPMRVALKESSQTLDEVVVVGYGKQKKVNVTGAVASVDSKTLESRPVQSVAQALQGQVPGLNVSAGNGGGELDNNLSINIRGAGTIGKGSIGRPLVLIDGIEGDLASVNPADIANISFLKDAASSSIYGARAAFGVLLVTTKSGKKGKARISYSGNVRWSTVTQIPKMMNSVEFANYFNEAAKNRNGTYVFTQEIIDKMKKYMAGEYKDPNSLDYYGTSERKDGYCQPYQGAFANTDWFKEFYRDFVPSQEHNLSISGGSDKITYLLSGSFLGQNGLLRFGKDNLQRYTLNAKFGAQLTDWLKVNYSSKWSRKDYAAPSYLSRLFYHNIARRWPNNPVRIPHNHYMSFMEIYELLEGGRKNSQQNWMTNQVQFVAEPIKDWHITLDGSLRQYQSKFHSDVLPVQDYKANGDPGLAKVGWNAPGYSGVNQSVATQDYYAVNAITDYSRHFGPHFMKVMAGFNAELFKDESLNGSMTDLITPLVPELAAAQNNPHVSNSKQELALAGFFGRVNYNYKETYLFEANFRYDGSSRFLNDRRWGFFPSFSAGWNMAHEQFFKNLFHDVNTFKLRASWGQLGNNETRGYYPFYLVMPTGSTNSKWLVNGKQMNTAGTPGIVSDQLTWETVESWDLGLDFGLLNNRLTGSFDYFQRYTYNMVAPPPPLPVILGTNPPSVNNADLKSYGWELELQWRDHINDFNYGVKFNIADSRRKILRYENPTGSLRDYYAGQTIGDIWGYTTAGIANSLEEMNKHLKANKPAWGKNWNAGDVMYKDLNGDSIVSSGAYTLQDHGDLRVIGNSTPRYNFGLLLDANWRGFDASIFMQGVLKRDYAFGPGEPYFWGVVSSMWQSAGFKEHLNYWTPKNKNAYYPRPIFGSNQNQQVQTRYLQNAAYMRIKNVQLGYSLPEKVLKNMGISRFRVYVSVDNLTTFTSLSKIFDPEALGGAAGAGKLYPLQRTISLGANINF